MAKNARPQIAGGQGRNSQEVEGTARGIDVVLSLFLTVVLAWGFGEAVAAIARWLAS